MRRRSAHLGVTVEESREPGGLMRTEGDLLNDADATAVAHDRRHHVEDATDLVGWAARCSMSMAEKSAAANSGIQWPTSSMTSKR